MKLNYNNTLQHSGNLSPGMLTDRLKKGIMLAAALLLLTSAQLFAQDDYCIPAPDYADGDGITNVSVGIINNTTVLEPTNYGNYTAQVVNMGRGASYPISITLGTFTIYNVKVWVDWNNNNTFEPAEQILTQNSEEAPVSTVRGAITVPTGASLGRHRMRVGATIEYSSPVQPCYIGFDAAAYEDYTINVTATPSCYIPLNPTAVNTGPGTINLSWTTPNGGGIPAGYEYALTTTNTPPASGIAVTSASLTGITVPQEVNGYIFVRTNCGGGNYSDWVSGSFYNGFCIPAPQEVNGRGITNVTIGTINNETLAETGNYGNFSAQVVNVGQSVTQPFSIALSTNSSSYEVRMWIDWNNNLIFDENELVYSGTSANRATSILRGTFTVPATASLGNHRIRIGGALVFGGDISPCFTDYLGTFEDYTVNVTPPPSCFAPVNPTGTTVSSGVANISWSVPALGATPAAYEYAVTTSATPPANGTPTTATSAAGVTVTPNETNFIHVRTNCGGGDFSSWMTAPYYNGYCTPEPQFSDGQGITNVTIGSINNTTPAEPTNYGDYTNLVANIGQGVSKQFSISYNTDGPSYSTKIWVDWNNDLDFNDAGEEVYTGTTLNAINTVLNGYINVPLTATLGNHRMRIGSTPENGGNIPDPCTVENYGIYEDYTINVTTPPSCYNPTGLTAMSEGSGFAAINFTAPTFGGTPAGYQYAVTAIATPPATGTPTTATTVSGIVVTPNALNYFHVRTNCGGTDFSEWITVSLYNGYCVPAPQTVDGEGLTNFNIGSINNSTSDQETYSDFSGQVVNIGQSVTQQFSMGLFTYNPYEINMWIDFNDDLIFDESEVVYSGLSPEGVRSVIRSTITIPATAPLGNHRLRIAGASNGNEATPCDIRYFGFYEDYTVNVTVPPTCYTPLDPTATIIGSGNVNLSWTVSTLGTTPAGYEYAVTTTPVTPTSGTPVTGTTVTGFDIEDDVYYYLQVRSNCGGGDFSEWVISERFRYLRGDICTTAIDLGALSSPYSSSTDGAANDFTPSCGYGAGPDVYHSIAVPNGYSLNIGVTSSNYDFIGALFYGGCSTITPTRIFCTDTFSEVFTTTWENLTGQTQTLYWVQDGYESYSGTYTLTWSLTPPPACDRPRQLDATITSLTTANVSWIVPNTGSPAGYEYAVTTSSTPPDSGTVTPNLFATAVTVTPNVNSYLHVRSVCGDDGESVWETYAFFSGYCVPENTESTENYITGVTSTGGESNFSNTGTGFSAFTDYTSQYAVTSYAGGSFSLTATHPADQYIYAVWIDWNRNFEFTDARERVVYTSYTTSPANLGSIPIPPNTPEGTYRMRIRNSRASDLESCGEGGGETEDYTIIVGPAPTCFPPYGLSITPIDTNIAELRWSAPLAGNTPAGYEYVFSNSSVAPTGNGTPTTERFIENATFNPAQSVYLFVRSTCGEGEYSSWANVAVLNANTPQFADSSVMVYKENSAINITSGTTLMNSVNVYDTRGRILYSQDNINNTKTAIIGMQILQQVIIVEVVTAKGKVSKRIVF